jgi:hypothetical protein
MTDAPKKDIMEIAAYAVVPAQVPEEEKAGALASVQTFLSEVRSFLYAAAGGETVTAKPAIRDTATRTLAAQIVAKARAEVKRYEGVMKAPVAAAKLAHTAACEARTELCRPYAQADALLTPLINAFDTEQARIEAERVRAERVRLEAERVAEQKRLEDERLAAAVQAEADGNDEIAELLIEKVEAPAVYVAPVAAPPKPKGNYQVTVWHFEVTDAAAVPREFLAIDTKALQDHADIKGDTVPVAGVRFFSTIDNRFRR